MSAIDDILTRLEHLTQEVRLLKDKRPPNQAGVDLQLIVDEIKGQINAQGLKDKDKYICHAVIDTVGGASVQLTWLQAVKKDDSFSTASFCMALANEHRINILKALSEQELSTAQLTGFTGLEGGPLYHHIKELIKARFVHQKGRSCYQITQEGLDALLTVAALNRRNTWGLKEEVWQRGDRDED